MSSSRRLQKEFRDLSKDPTPGFIAAPMDPNNLYEWEVTIMGPPDTYYEYGCFTARMSFPQDYPLSPVRILGNIAPFLTWLLIVSAYFDSQRSGLWLRCGIQTCIKADKLVHCSLSRYCIHGNFQRDGEVCISILHPPGADPTGYESSNERWSPVQSISTILLSIMSLLAEPNNESPANVEGITFCNFLWELQCVAAAKMCREQPDEFSKRVRQTVEASLGIWWSYAVYTISLNCFRYHLRIELMRHTPQTKCTTQCFIRRIVTLWKKADVIDNVQGKLKCAWTIPVPFVFIVHRRWV